MRAGRPRSRVGLLPFLLLLKGTCAGLPGRSPADAAEPSVHQALARPRSPRLPTLHTSPFKLQNPGATAILSLMDLGMETEVMGPWGSGLETQATTSLPRATSGDAGSFNRRKVKE